MASGERRIPLADARRIAGRLIATAKYRSGGGRLNKEQIAQRIARGKCEVTGVPFEYEGHGQLNSHPLHASLDRIDPGKPYTTRNVLVTAWFWNRLRSDLPLNDAVTLLKRSAHAASTPITP